MVSIAVYFLKITFLNHFLHDIISLMGFPAHLNFPIAVTLKLDKILAVKMLFHKGEVLKK